MNSRSRGRFNDSKNRGNVGHFEDNHYFSLSRNTSFGMELQRSRKAEKIRTEMLSGEALDVVNEMLDIIVTRTHSDNPNQSLVGESV